MLIIHEYRHAIEYHLQRHRDRREHVYTEFVNDQGFVLVHDPAKRPDWLAHYARCCAEDYLARRRAKAGVWFVHVYRLRDDGRQHVVSIRMNWPAPQAEDPQGTNTQRAEHT